MLDYMAGNESFSEMAGFTTLNFNLTGERDAQRVQAARVSPSHMISRAPAPCSVMTMLPSR